MLVKSQVKYIQSLSQKKLRDEAGVFVAEGPKIINELLRSGNIHAKQIFATEEWSAPNPVPDTDILVAVSPAELERLSFQQTPNQVIGIFAKPVFPKTISWNNTISLMLDTIQDPGNMGTIMRCADWFGVKQIVCSRDSADVYNPKVVQASMGSIGRVQVLYEDLASFLDEHNTVPVYATTLDGADLYSMAGIQSGFILIGNESKGINEALLAKSRYRITIPKKGEAESLNAAVATGIILSHIVKSI
jgi:RNA methyltransferase, TrmH family